MKKQQILKEINLLLLVILITSIILTVNLPSVNGEILINETFETGNHSLWSEDNAGTYINEVNSDASIFGTYGQRTSTTGNSAKSLIYQYHDALTVENTEFYVKLEDLDVYPFGSDFSTMLYEARNSGESVAFTLRIMENATNVYWQIGIAGGATWFWDISVPPIEGNIYHFEITMEISATANFLVSINGTEVLNEVSDSSSITSIQREYIGIQGSNDDLVVQSYIYDNILIGEFEASEYEPLFNSDMKLQVVGNSTFLPNDTQIILKGVNKNGAFEDDPDGIWNSETMWTDENVGIELDAMKELNVNLLRVLGSVYGWYLETGDENSAIGQKEALQKLVNMSAERGIWVLYSGYRTGDYFHNNMTTYEALPYPPYTNNTYIHNETEFVNWCADVASNMKDYGNFLFEAWNEPEAGTKEDWFLVEQDIINAMRFNGFTQPIIVQWGVSSWINLNFPTRQDGSEPMDWISASGLTDVQNNLIYSNHQYRNHIHHSIPEWEASYIYQDIYDGLEYMKLFENTQNYSLIWGEIGGDGDWTGEDLIKEESFFNNTLNIINNTGIHFAGWTWRFSAGQGYELIDSNYNKTSMGDIYFEYLGISSDVEPEPEPETIPTTELGTVIVIIVIIMLVVGWGQKQIRF